MSLSSQKSQKLVKLTHMHLQTEFVLVILPSVREKEDFSITRPKKKKNSLCSIRLAVVKLLNPVELCK